MDKLWLSIFFGFLPGIFWLIYFYLKDSIEPEPKGKIAKAFILGILTAIPVLLVGILPYRFIELYFGKNEFYSAVIIAPILEEGFKFFVVYYFFFKDKEFDEPMDGIIYTVSVALGFASIENVGYVYNSFATGNMEKTILARAFLTVPGHALFASFYGYAMGVIKFKVDSKVTYTNALLAAMLAHGLFNLSAVSGRYGFSFLIFIVIFVLWKIVNKNIKFLKANTTHTNNKNTP